MTGTGSDFSPLYVRRLDRSASVDGPLVELHRLPTGSRASTVCDPDGHPIAVHGEA